MAAVSILNVTVLDNPTAFVNPLQFEIQFECLQALDEDLEWKLIYVGSAEDSSHDQVLEEVMVGPVVPGIHKFVLQTAAPNPQNIENQDLIGVTVILLTCSYMEQEFVRIGYYVNNEYSEPYDPDSPPNPVDINLLYRNILADQPRVTRFAIDWTGNAAAMPTEIIQEDAENIDAGNVNMMEDDNGLNTYGVDDEVVTSDDDDDDDDDVEIDLDGDASAEGEGDMEAMEEGDSGEDCGDVDEVTGGQSMQGMGAGMEVILNEDSMDVQRMRVIHSEVSNSYM